MHKTINKSVCMDGLPSFDEAWNIAMSIKAKYNEEGLFTSYFLVRHDEYAEPPSWEIEVRAKRLDNVVDEGTE